jgi:hypothetical protein
MRGDALAGKNLLGFDRRQTRRIEPGTPINLIENINLRKVRTPLVTE